MNEKDEGVKERGGENEGNGRRLGGPDITIVCVCSVFYAQFCHLPPRSYCGLCPIFFFFFFFFFLIFVSIIFIYFCAGWGMGHDYSVSPSCLPQVAISVLSTKKNFKSIPCKLFNESGQSPRAPSSPSLSFVSFRLSLSVSLSLSLSLSVSHFLFFFHFYCVINVYFLLLIANDVIYQKLYIYVLPNQI